MSHDLLAMLVMVDIAMSGTALWLIKSTLHAERARSDRYAAAHLTIQGESKAGSTISTPKEQVPADGRTRPTQIGLSGR